MPLPDRTLQVLRAYWCMHRHPSLLFPGQGKYGNQPMARGGIQKALKQVCIDCSIHKQISPHSLRHCYATHLLQQGLDLRSLQVLLGHGSLNTTARYTRLTEVKQADTRHAVNQLADTIVVKWRQE